MSTVTASEVLTSGLGNLLEEPGYAVHHGWKPVSDFSYRPPRNSNGFDVPSEHAHNFWALAFPTLFPYSEGGIEEARLVYMKFNDHIQYCLSHYTQ